MHPNRLVPLLKALAEPNRLQLVLHLADGESGPGDLAHELGMNQPSISRHVRILRDAGVVVERRSGRNAYYSLEDNELVDSVLDVLGHGPARRPIPPGLGATRPDPDASDSVPEPPGDAEPSADTPSRDRDIEEWLL